MTDLAYNTPVDTGLHVSSWSVGLDRPGISRGSPYVPGSGGSTAPQNAQRVIRAARGAVRYKKPGQTIYISNDAPAIVELNNGSSSKAPAGFVERAILIARNYAKLVRTTK